jgi:hypothetical protein
MAYAMKFAKRELVQHLGMASCMHLGMGADACELF